MTKEITKQRPPKGKFVIREGEGRESRWSIVLQYVVDGKTAKTTFGETIKREQWNETQQKIVRHPNQARLNNMLEKYRNQFDMLILEHFKKHQRILIKDLRYILANRRLPGERTVIADIGKDILDNAKAQGRISSSTYTNGISALKIFQQFVSLKHPEWGEEYALTDELVEEYVTWRKVERRNSWETINKALTPLIRVAERLRLSDKMSPEMYDKISRMYLPPEKKSLSASEMNEDRIKFLTHDEFGELLAYRENCKLPRTVDYLDMFCFAVFSGLRWSDIVTLEWGHIDLERGLMKKVLVKGKRQGYLEIGLCSEAVVILSKWHERTSEKRFIFGLLDDDADIDDDDFLRTSTQSKSRSMNTVFDRVAKEMGLKHLNFHMSRHTFAIWALNEGRHDVKQISAMLGHASVLTTESFYARYIPGYENRA